MIATSLTWPAPETAAATTACVPDIELIVATELPPVYTLDLILNSCVPVPELVTVIAVPTSASCGVSANLTLSPSPMLMI